MVTQLKSKFKNYCIDCHYTIWQGEMINYDGKPHHQDCLSALKDETPRTLNPHVEKMLGKANKSKVVSLLEEKSSEGKALASPAKKAGLQEVSLSLKEIENVVDQIYDLRTEGLVEERSPLDLLGAYLFNKHLKRKEGQNQD